MHCALINQWPITLIGKTLETAHWDPKTNTSGFNNLRVLPNQGSLNLWNQTSFGKEIPFFVIVGPILLAKMATLRPLKITQSGISPPKIGQLKKTQLILLDNDLRVLNPEWQVSGSQGFNVRPSWISIIMFWWYCIFKWFGTFRQPLRCYFLVSMARTRTKLCFWLGTQGYIWKVCLPHCLEMG